MTTKSSQALTTIGTPCADIDSYDKLIDGTYFLVYKGSGACSRLPKPPPSFVMDVKFLRTAIRHDVDHGDPDDIRKKKKRAGETFERYSGKKTPEECGPDELLLTHVRILQSMLSFLSEMGG